MVKKDNNNTLSRDSDLLNVINTSYLTLEDIAWLKKKRWFKRFLKIYSKELKKRYKGKPLIKKDIKPKEEDIEILDFTKTINIPKKEVIEILDFTKTIDITDVKDITEASNIAKRKIKREKAIWSFIITISSFVLIILLVILLNWILENMKTDDVLEEIYEVSDVKEIKTTTQKGEENKNITTTTSLYDKYGNMSILEVNFDNLRKINPDTVGWIKVNGTKINYPFVHTNDNEYYLKHTFDKTSNKKGWVFLDFRNDIENLSENTILYAHGLVNNQMFGSMRKVIKPTWYNNKNNHIITVATPSGTRHFKVFSSYTILPESYYITTNFKTEDEFKIFIDTIKQRSVYNYGVDVNINDKILTLSSCYDNEKRMVLHAKLID